MSDEDDMSESDIANRLTDEYAGDLLANALRIYIASLEDDQPPPMMWGLIQRIMDPPSRPPPMRPLALILNA